MTKYWLFKSEPGAFSIQDLAECPNATAEWDGVRNFTARNLLRDEIKIGDRVLFYHSNARPPGVVGTAKVVKEGYPDHTAWDPNHAGFHARSKKEKPWWYMVDIQLDSVFPRKVTLEELKHSKGLREMGAVQKGNRLSVQPVTPAEWKIVLALAKTPPQ